MSSLIPHDYRYKISSPTPVDKEPIKKEITEEVVISFLIHYFVNSDHSVMFPV